MGRGTWPQTKEIAYDILHIFSINLYIRLARMSYSEINVRVRLIYQALFFLSMLLTLKRRMCAKTERVKFTYVVYNNLY